MRMLGACVVAIATLGAPAQACPFHDLGFYEEANYSAPQRFSPFALRNQLGGTLAEPDIEAPRLGSNDGEQNSLENDTVQAPSELAAPQAVQEDQSSRARSDGIER